MYRSSFRHLTATMILVLLVLATPLTVLSAVPRTINYQGYLTASDGTPVSKSVIMHLALYDAQTGGTLLWAEQQTVTVDSGQYSVNLGSVTALNLPFDKPYYLGVKIDADQEMVPRLLVTSSPYALRSATADAVADASVGSASIANGSVTASKLGITCTAGQVLISTASGWGCGTVSTGGSGTITSIIAGNGLKSTASNGSVQLDVDFAGTGTGTTAARSDHNHDAIYQKKYAKVAVVAASGGDYSTPGAALAGTASWCGTPSSANPCLVKIMPGTYDMATSSLTMKSYVDVDGSGKNNTFITGTLDSLTAGVVNGASNSTLSNLTVRNTGGTANQTAIAVFNNAASTRIDGVTASAGGAAKSYALYDTGAGVVKVSNSDLNGATNTVFNGSGATTHIFATTFSGGPVANSGTGIIKCAAVTDANDTLFLRSCPPFNELQVVNTQPLQPVMTPFAANGIIKAQFNNDLNPTTVTAATFKVLDNSSGSALPGTVSYDAATRSAVFTPSVPLTAISMRAVVTTGIRDIYGSSLQSEYSWTIWGGPSDSTPLAVQSSSPVAGSTGLVANVPISVTFNKAIDAIAVSGSNLTVKDAANTAVAGVVAAYSSTVSFTPTTPLALGRTYTVTVSGVKDLSGTAMSAPYSYSFTTAPLSSPIGVNATASSTQATVKWQSVPGATSYNLYWSTKPFGTAAGGTSPTGGSGPVTKISNVTSPYQHTVPQTSSFTGSVQVAATGTLAAGQKIGSVGFDVNLPASVPAYGVTVTVTDATSNATLFTNQSSGYVIRVVVGAPSGIPIGPLVNLFCNWNLSGVTAADFSISNVQVSDTTGAAIAGITVSTVDSSTAGVTYYYAVTAAGISGESAMSSTVSAYIDPKPPVVLSVSPAGTSVNPANVSTIEVKLSEPVDMKTVTAATFSVTVAGNPITGSLGSGYGTIPSMVFTPSSPLAEATTFTVALTAAIKDLAGNALKAYSSQFATSIPAPAGLTASRSGQQVVLKWLPVTGAQAYNVYWSNSSSLTKLNGMKIGNLTGTSYTHSGLTEGTWYNYVVTAVSGGVESVESNQASLTIDSLPPTVTSTVPASNATGVDTGTGICVNFSESIDTSTWNSLTVAVKDGAGNVVNGMFNNGYVPNCWGASFAPNGGFVYGTTYNITISGISDNSGNRLAAPYSFSFTTTPAIPTGLVATAGALQTTLSWTPVSGAVSYNIYWANAPNVTKSNSQKISGITTASYLHTNLANGSTYYYRISAVSSGGESTLSNEVKAGFDTAAPVVVSTYPGSGPGASPTSYVNAVFNEAIDTASVTPTTLTVKDGTGAPVYGASSTSGGTVVEYRTSGGVDLNNGTTYTATISGVKDLSGNVMAPYSWSFTIQPLGVPIATATAGAAGSKEITVSWPGVWYATSYNVYWSTSPNVNTSNGTKVIGAMSPFTHTGLTAGSTYYFVVTAVSGQAEGVGSEVVSAVAP